MRIIINADDFGANRIFDEKMLDLLRKNIILSTTVMILRISEESLSELKKIDGISVGLHLEGEHEFSEQEEKFISLFGKKPSHIDVHKYIDDDEMQEKVVRFCNERGYKTRSVMKVRNGETTDTPAWIISLQNLDAIKKHVLSLPEGTHELVAHPGAYDPDSPSSLNKEREDDYNNLLMLKPWLDEKKIELISYNEL